MNIKKIELQRGLNRDNWAFDCHDLLREGRQNELSPKKVAVILKMIIEKINQMADEFNGLEDTLFGEDKNKLDSTDKLIHRK